ncbi:tetratricopeptide repeat protein [Hanstruepera marina]|uniref:tetratricopeptide repeat protein n=1 Tax=Hanstruepera marina TaxID=2873265 RepID=UPI001CA75A82|nr:tetratricopeptide repeat protein [Hanstruepera marina]
MTFNMATKTAFHAVPLQTNSNKRFFKVDKLLFTFILICLLNPMVTLSQNQKKIDSLETVYNTSKDDKQRLRALQKLFNATLHSNNNDALEYAKQGLALSKKTRLKTAQGDFYRNHAYYYRFLPNIDSSRYYYQQAVDVMQKAKPGKRTCWNYEEYATLEILQGNFEKGLILLDSSMAVAKKLKNGLLIASAVGRKTTTYIDMGKFDLATQQGLKSLKILDTLKKPSLKGEGITLGHLGRIEMLRGNSEEAMNYLLKSLDKFKEINNTEWLSITYNEIGNLEIENQNFDLALENYQKALTYSKELNRPDMEIMNLANIAMTYSDKGDYKKALKSMQESVFISNTIQSMNNLIVGHNMLGEIYRNDKQYGNSIESYDKAVAFADSISALKLLEEAYQGRSLSYEKNSNFKQALLDQRNYQTIHDSIFNLDSAKEIEELKVKYETEKKENELLKKENDIVVLEAQKKKDDSFRLILIIALISAILIGLMTAYSLRQKIKRNRAEKEKLDNELSFKKKELTSHALHLAKKNEVLQEIKAKAKELKYSNSSSGYQQLIQTINFDLKDDNNWENFKKYFEEVHKDFNNNVKKKYPEVTSNELRLMALLKMNLSSKEIANILNISSEGIKKARYRLRKKLDLSSDDSLQDLVIKL